MPVYHPPTPFHLPTPTIPRYSDTPPASNSATTPCCFGCVADTAGTSKTGNRSPSPRPPLPPPLPLPTASPLAPVATPAAAVFPLTLLPRKKAPKSNATSCSLSQSSLAFSSGVGLMPRSLSPPLPPFSSDDDDRFRRHPRPRLMRRFHRTKVMTTTKRMVPAAAPTPTPILAARDMPCEEGEGVVDGLLLLLLPLEEEEESVLVSSTVVLGSPLVFWRMGAVLGLVFWGVGAVLVLVLLLMLPSPLSELEALGPELPESTPSTAATAPVGAGGTKTDVSVEPPTVIRVRTGDADADGCSAGAGMDVCASVGAALAVVAAGAAVDAGGLDWPAEESAGGRAAAGVEAEATPAFAEEGAGAAAAAEVADAGAGAGIDTVDASCVDSGGGAGGATGCVCWAPGACWPAVEAGGACSIAEAGACSEVGSGVGTELAGVESGIGSWVGSWVVCSGAEVCAAVCAADSAEVFAGSVAAGSGLGSGEPVAGGSWASADVVAAAALPLPSKPVGPTTGSRIGPRTLVAAATPLPTNPSTSPAAETFPDEPDPSTAELLAASLLFSTPSAKPNWAAASAACSQRTRMTSIVAPRRSRNGN
ncbi:dd037cf0-2476-49c9-a6ea-de0249af7290 [Thermothielavioides terrestris]|uniref:Dd037cf0-2476-49c9-a6ea-de0249af7290 n=1 Tax=Thermothielavioides terrestris TaxID=2587410 RepID=A0A446BSQ0_9PEZI|nr:dd037cf0-2476-49c9-a6ea-de0249af7290 [Thermothielavioides terrestris]